MYYSSSQRLQLESGLLVLVLYEHGEAVSRDEVTMQMAEQTLEDLEGRDEGTVTAQASCGLVSNPSFLLHSIFLILAILF